jgi:hypothetical protein
MEAIKNFKLSIGEKVGIGIILIVGLLCAVPVLVVSIPFFIVYKIKRVAVEKMAEVRKMEEIQIIKEDREEERSWKKHKEEVLNG